jgi:hypothetical protein
VAERFTLKIRQLAGRNDCGFEIADCGLTHPQNLCWIAIFKVAAINPQSEFRNPQFLWLVLN